jgi:hypothetical protein
MPPETPTKTSETPVTPGYSLNRSQFLVGGLILSLLCNVALLVVFVQEKNTPKPPLVQFPDILETSDEIYQEEYSEDLVDLSDSPIPAPELTTDSTDYSKYYTSLVSQDGVEWFDLPELLSDLNLIESINMNEYRINQLAYYQIGTRNNEPIVYVEVPCDDMMCRSYAFFVTHSDGSATFIAKNSSVNFDSNWTATKLRPNVSTDADYSFTALLTPQEISLDDGFAIQKTWSDLQIHSQTMFNSDDFGDGQIKIEFLKETASGPLFRAYMPDTDVGTADYQYAIRLPGGLHMAYDEKTLGFMTDDRVPQITWLDGGVNTDQYRGDQLTGCGGGGPESLLEPLREPKVELVGRTKTGEAVYNLVDPNHPLVTRVFEITDGIVYEYDPQTGMSTNTIITPAEFIANRGVLLVESAGRQLVFTNTKYGPQAECGKPVIYLYPEATTTISVSVDALVTKSEPEYESGWVATAHPDGSLIVNGQPYTSLFWDGYGNGAYPELEQGFVVPTSEVLTVMSDHLRYIGFTEFEISEFVAFWSDHLPSEPYTKFSWLQTREMEQMAKLTITPKPDTLIRAFVDYEGVSEMIDLEPQKLIKRARNGYVVTEWGGLLRK